MIGTPLSLPVEATTPRKWEILVEGVEWLEAPPDESEEYTGETVHRLHLDLTATEALAVANHLMATLGQPEALDCDLADRIGWTGKQ